MIYVISSCLDPQCQYHEISSASNARPEDCPECGYRMYFEYFDKPEAKKRATRWQNSDFASLTPWDGYSTGSLSHRGLVWNAGEF